MDTETSEEQKKKKKNTLSEYPRVIDDLRKKNFKLCYDCGSRRNEILESPP